MLPNNDTKKALISKDLITYVTDRKEHDRRYADAKWHWKKKWYEMKIWGKLSVGNA